MRVHAGELGEHGPLAREPAVELRGADLPELARLLAFEVPPARFRVPSLGQCALELRGRVFRVGLLGLEATGELRVMGWGSDVRLRDPAALFSWIASKGGPSLLEEHQRGVATAAVEDAAAMDAARTWVGAAPAALAALATAALDNRAPTRAALLGPHAEALRTAEPRAARRIADLLRWLGAPGRPWSRSGLAALPGGLLSYERIADVLDVIEQGPLDEAQRRGAVAYLSMVAGHGLVAARAARWPEALRAQLPERALIEACRDVEGGQIVATSAHGRQLSAVHLEGEGEVALALALALVIDGPLLVRVTRAEGARALAPMERLLGVAGGVAHGVLGSEIVAIRIDAAEGAPLERLGPWSGNASVQAALSPPALYRSESEHRRRGAETWSRVLREPLGAGPSEVIVPDRRGVVTGLAVARGDVLAVFRRPTSPWFGEPRARHELLRLPAGGAAPEVVHSLETEPGVSFSLAVGPRDGGGARAWLWSRGLAAVLWFDLPSGPRGEVIAGAPVRDLAAGGDGAWALVERGAARLEVVHLRPSGPPEVAGALRCDAHDAEIHAGEGGVYVAACEKLLRFPS